MIDKFVKDHKWISCAQHIVASEHSQVEPTKKYTGGQETSAEYGEWCKLQTILSILECRSGIIGHLNEEERLSTPVYELNLTNLEALVVVRKKRTKKEESKLMEDKRMQDLWEILERDQELWLEMSEHLQHQRYVKKLEEPYKTERNQIEKEIWKKIQPSFTNLIWNIQSELEELR